MMLTVLSGGHGPSLYIEGFYLIDFIVLLSILIWLTRKPLKSFLSSRRARIVTDMEEAQKMRAEAEAKLKEYEARLAHIEEEIQDILAKAREAGEEERKRILVNATHAAEQIRADAKARLEQEGRKLAVTLREKMVSLALEEAQTELQGQADKHQGQFVTEYIDQIQQVEGLL